MFPLKDNIPTDRFPIVTVLLIAINIVVFAWMLTLDNDLDSSRSPEVQGLSQYDEVILELGAIPYRLMHPGTGCGVVTATARAADKVDDTVVCEDSDAERAANDIRGVEVVPLEEPPALATVFTSMFMHGGWLHIIGNMIFLWVFGTNVEDRLGRLRFLLFYLLAGVAAVFAQSLLDTTATTPTIGASGAVAGVLGGYLLLYPKARVLTLVFIIFYITIIEVPATILLLAWLALQFVPAIGQITTDVQTSGDSVAYFAHLGGFAFGLIVIKLFLLTRGRAGPAQPGY